MRKNTTKMRRLPGERTKKGRGRRKVERKKQANNRERLKKITKVVVGPTVVKSDQPHPHKKDYKKIKT